MMNNAWSAYSATSVPAFLELPIGVVNDGRRRTAIWVNEGYNPMDGTTSPEGATCPASGGQKPFCAVAYPSYPMSITLDISAWAVPVTSTRALRPFCPSVLNPQLQPYTAALDPTLQHSTLHCSTQPLTLRKLRQSAGQPAADKFPADGLPPEP